MNKKLFIAIRLLLIAVFVFAACGINANSNFRIIMEYTGAELTITGPVIYAEGAVGLLGRQAVSRC